MNLCLKSYTFHLYFILFLHVWIRIHKAPEYGSNADPDPQHWLVVTTCGEGFCATTVQISSQKRDKAKDSASAHPVQKSTINFSLKILYSTPTNSN